MHEIKRETVQNSFEQGLRTDPSLNMSTVDMMRVMEAAGQLPPEMQADHQYLEKHLDFTSEATCKLFSCAFDAKGECLDCARVSQGLGGHDLATLDKLSEYLTDGNHDRATALQAAFRKGGAARQDALDSVAEMLLDAADDAKKIKQILAIIITDPKNISLRPIYDKFVGYMQELEEYAERLLRDVMRVFQKNEVGSYTDAVQAIPDPIKRHDGSTPQQNADYVIFDQTNDIIRTVKTAEEVAQAVRETGQQRKISQLKDEIQRLLDDAFREHSQSLSDAPNEAYDHQIRYTRDLVEADNRLREVKDLLGNIS